MSSQQTRSYLVIPAAIVIAGVLISASLFVAFGKTATTVTTTTTTTVTATSVSTHTVIITSNGTDTSSVSTTNSSNGLQLSLQQIRYGNDSFTVQVEDFNPLNSTDDVNGTDGWRVYPDVLNPYDNCPSSLPVGFAIAKGYYTIDNISSSIIPLPLYNTNFTTTCSLSIFTGEFDFRPASDVFTQNPGTPYQFTEATGFSFRVHGYYTGGQESSSPAELTPFGVGNYTIIGADEWGEVILLYFSVG